MITVYVIAWVYIGAFVFWVGFWCGARLGWRQREREAERVRDKAIEYVYRTAGWGIGQLAMFYADLGGTGGAPRSGPRTFPAEEVSRG